MNARELGTEREFLWRIVMPELFVFAALVLAGSALEEPWPSLLLKLGVIVYLLCVTVMLDAVGRLMRFDLVAAHLSMLAVGVTGTALATGLEPWRDVYLPLLFVLALLLPVRLRLVTAYRVCAVIAVTVLAYVSVELARREAPGRGDAAALLGIALLLFGIFLRALLRSRGADARLTGIRPAQAQPAREAEALSPDAGAAQQQLAEIARLTHLREMRSEFVWRVLMHLLAGAGMTVWIAVGRGRENLVLGGGWILLAGIELILLRSILNARGMVQLCGAAFAAALVPFGWWALTVTLSDPGPAVGALVLLALALSSAGLPWPSRWNCSWCILAAVIALTAASSAGAPYIVALAVLVAVPILMRRNALSYLATRLRASLLYLRKVLESHPRVLDALTMTGFELMSAGDADAALVVFEHQPARRLVARGRVESAAVDPIVGESLRNVLERHGIDQAWLGQPQLGGDLTLAVSRALERKFSHAFVCRLTAVLDEREEEVVIVVPASLNAYLAGGSRMASTLSAIAGFARAWLAGARSRYLSSDVLLSSERALSQRENEFGEIIHLVNNVAQDIAAHCDALYELLESKHADRDGTGEKVPLLVEQIEDCTRMLSGGVSDLRRARELLKLRITRRRERCEVRGVLDELRSFARYRSLRTGVSYEIDAAPAGAVIELASRELLDTVLRLALRAAEERSRRAGSVRLGVAVDSENVRFSITDAGPPVNLVRFLDGETGGAHGAPERDALAVRCAQRLAIVSDASIAASEGTEPNRLDLVFRRGAELAVPTLGDGQWALLVDDNVQVTEFYGKIAEALSLRYFTAASLADAERILSSNGKPRLVVSDLQLGDESGLELVRALRSRFGSDLPIIVVSGKTGHDVASEVLEAGATRFLSKPVGRGKLFEEIRTALA